MRIAHRSRSNDCLTIQYDLSIKNRDMKRLFLILAISGAFIACNNASETTENKKDSLDSIANEKKDMIDSSAEQKKDMIDSTTEKKKDALDRRDSARRKDSTR